MAKQSKNCLASKSQESKWILYSVPFLFIIGSLFHFAYEFTGKNIIVGFFTPINESIWEHIKLILTPLLLWWILFFWSRIVPSSSKITIRAVGCSLHAYGKR